MFSYKLGDRERSREQFLRDLRRTEEEERRAKKAAGKRREHKPVNTDDEYPTTRAVRTTYAQAYTHGGRRPPLETPASTDKELDPKRVSYWHVVNKVTWLVLWFYPYALQSYLVHKRENEEGTSNDPASCSFYAQEEFRPEDQRNVEFEELLYKEFSLHLSSNGRYKFDATLRKFEAYKRVRNPTYSSPWTYLWEDPRWDEACRWAFQTSSLRPSACELKEDVSEGDSAFILHYKMYDVQWARIPGLGLGGGTALDFKNIIWPHLPPPESPEDMTTAGVKDFFKKAYWLGLVKSILGVPFNRPGPFDRTYLSRFDKCTLGEYEMDRWCIDNFNTFAYPRIKSERMRKRVEMAALVVKRALVEFVKEWDSDLTAELQSVEH